MCWSSDFMMILWVHYVILIVQRSSIVHELISWLFCFIEDGSLGSSHHKFHGSYGFIFMMIFLTNHNQCDIQHAILLTIHAWGLTWETQQWCHLMMITMIQTNDVLFSSPQLMSLTSLGFSPKSMHAVWSRSTKCLDCYSGCLITITTVPLKSF